MMLHIHCLSPSAKAVCDLGVTDIFGLYVKFFSTSCFEKYLRLLAMGTLSFKKTKVLSSIGSALGLEKRHGPSCASTASLASTVGNFKLFAKHKSPFASPLRAGSPAASTVAVPGKGGSSSSASDVIGDSSSRLLRLEMVGEPDDADDLVPRLANLLVKEESAPPASMTMSVMQPEDAESRPTLLRTVGFTDYIGVLLPLRGLRLHVALCAKTKAGLMTRHGSSLSQSDGFLWQQVLVLLRKRIDPRVPS